MSAPLETRVTELERAFDVLVGVIEDLKTAAQTTTGQATSWQPQPPPTDLAAWVDWFITTGCVPAQPDHRIPPFWSQHPGKFTELTTLWHTWQNAFLHPAADPEAAQNWHDRWLPGLFTASATGFLPNASTAATRPAPTGNLSTPIAPRRRGSAPAP